MKSIYEASVAYGREHQGTVNIEDFEAGANYVLEQIENLVKTTIADGDTYHYNLYISLVNLLEQLKKISKL